MCVTAAVVICAIIIGLLVHHFFFTKPPTISKTNAKKTLDVINNTDEHINIDRNNQNHNSNKIAPLDSHGGDPPINSHGGDAPIDSHS